MRRGQPARPVPLQDAPTPRPGPAATCSTAPCPSLQSPRPARPRPPCTRAEISPQAGATRRRPITGSGRLCAACRPAALTSLLPRAQPPARSLTWPAPPSPKPGGVAYEATANGLLTARACSASFSLGPPSLASAHARPRPRQSSSESVWRRGRQSLAPRPAQQEGPRTGAGCGAAPQEGVGPRQDAAFGSD